MKKNLNYSLQHQAYLKKVKKKNILIIALQIFILVALIGFWELFAYVGIIDSFFMSSPSRMINTIVELCASGELFTHIWTTLYEAILAFVIATSLGLVIAIALWWSETLRRVLDPYIVLSISSWK